MRDFTGQIEKVRMTLETTLGRPGQWELLFHENGDLIEGAAERVDPQNTLTNPFLEKGKSMGKPESMYVDGEDKEEWPTIPVLCDWEIIKAFQSAGCLERLPRFYIAGEPRDFRLDPTRARFGILVAGGNAAGLNMVVDSIVKRITGLASERMGDKPFRPIIYGYEGGYQGLKTSTCFEGVNQLGRLTIEDTDPRAGDPCTFLKTLRGKVFEIPSPGADEELDELANAVKRDRLDVLFVIGGNGTFTWANELYKKLKLKEENRKIALIGGPKTMDWDINFADATFGFRTAVDNSVEFIRTVHWEAQSQNRLAVIELFGARSGFVALHAGFLSGEADYILIPEFQEILGSADYNIPEVEDILDQKDKEGRISELRRLLKKTWEKHLFVQLYKRLKKRDHAVLVVAEGALVNFKHGEHTEKEQAFNRFLEWLKELFPDRGLVDVRPRHLIRGTPPCSFDLDLAKYTGYLMADAALAGFTNCSVQLWQGNHVLVPLPTAVARLGQVQPWSPYFWYMAQRYLLPAS